jgi:hypothetical protein
MLELQISAGLTYARLKAQNGNYGQPENPDLDAYGFACEIAAGLKSSRRMCRLMTPSTPRHAE